ncbi:adenylate/guanylate cyclase domain-containing protein [Arenibacter sp. BSSL-BM3]|uniref:Adenylate/guanylate cyclase domain-containing protein n=1 Tax=Arenibacter arenosicollis TaxID=2762274 RepID=A0ABR7QS53_9FLAO|nr:adenylate/guanylate cyclase domain-containing protein [Arenibacter arenosicollis]MBC8770019.1 adenylate/guanylate cyclase domain-containing protein [Arenibacter arenosicollis]
MEKNIAILMADLSGYTALTETHGATSAADLIDKYIRIAENCLVGDSKLHQRTGDEIMFISDYPDFLLATALNLETSTTNEENFLQIHGSLHFGNVLTRGDSYFGSTVNLAARIAAKAAAGTFWCSDDFVASLTNNSICAFKSLGRHLFKNINGQKELFEVGIEKARTTYIDPICRMLIVNPQNAIHHPNENELYFCSTQCREEYNKTHCIVQGLEMQKQS